MQELLEWHRKSMRSYSETNKMLEAFIEKEKEQIKNSYNKGLKKGIEMNITESLKSNEPIKPYLRYL